MKITLLLAILVLFIGSDQIYKVDSFPVPYSLFTKEQALQDLRMQLLICALFDKKIEKEMLTRLIQSFTRADGDFKEMKSLVQNVPICRIYE